MTPQAAVPAIAQTQADPSGVIAVAPQRAPDWYDPHKARCPWGLGAGFVVYVLLPLAATMATTMAATMAATVAGTMPMGLAQRVPPLALRSKIPPTP